MTDFGWKEINPDQPAFSSREGYFWDDLAIWTGSIIEKDGRYYMFYTARCYEDQFVLTTHERRQTNRRGAEDAEVK